MCIAIIVYPGCDVINQVIQSQSISSLVIFLHGQKCKYFENEKSLQLTKNCLKPESAPKM